MAQVVLITGAAGGLGEHVTELFVQRNWHVIATALTDSERTKLESLPNCRVVMCDLMDPTQVRHLADALPSQLQAVVHLVGGIRAGRLLEESSPDEFEFMWRLNAWTTYLVMRATIPLLKQNKGAFVAIGARTALRTEVRKALYGAAKAAVIHLVLAAAEEGRPYGMRANVIVPSIIRTPANLEWARDGEENDWVSPQEIAELVYFFCSDAGRGVTGCVLPMYGKIPG